MINRKNWLDVQEFLLYLEEVRQNSPKTVKRRRGQLRHLLEWADHRLLTRADAIRPTFPTYLKGARNDGRDRPLSAGSLAAICNVARLFFNWAVMAHSARYKNLDPVWISTLQPPKVKNGVKERSIWTLEDVLGVLELPAHSLTEERDQAAIAFLFVSGMRADAFCSMPIKAVDVALHQVQQWPVLGVRTKNSKAATTFLLDIPELLEVVTAWDTKVRTQLAPDVMWYAHVNRDGTRFTGVTRAGRSRRDGLARGMKKLCERAELPYRSPHKLRHGHAVYALKKAEDVADLKAISQNLMHASLTTTDSIYGVLTDADVSDRIAALSKKETQANGNGFTDEQLAQLRQLMSGKL